MMELIDTSDSVHYFILFIFVSIFLVALIACIQEKKKYIKKVKAKQKGTIFIPDDEEID